MLFKRLGSISFALAFVFAIAVFTNLFYPYISKSFAQTGMLFSGGFAMLMNLLATRNDGENAGKNILFWIGSAVLLIGLLVKMMHWPGFSLLLLAGASISGLSFFYNPFSTENDSSEDDLLDQ